MKSHLAGSISLIPPFFLASLLSQDRTPAALSFVYSILSRDSRDSRRVIDRYRQIAPGYRCALPKYRGSSCPTRTDNAT